MYKNPNYFSRHVRESGLKIVASVLKFLTLNKSVLFAF